MSVGNSPDGKVALAVGQLRRQVMLESEAVYSVLALGAETVSVEVVRAPGLTAGRRFEFTREAVLRMDLLDGDATRG